MDEGPEEELSGEGGGQDEGGGEPDAPGGGPVPGVEPPESAGDQLGPGQAVEHPGGGVEGGVHHPHRPHKGCGQEGQAHRRPAGDGHQHIGKGGGAVHRRPPGQVPRHRGGHQAQKGGDDEQAGNQGGSRLPRGGAGGVGRRLGHRLPSGHREHQHGQQGGRTAEVEFQPTVGGVDRRVEVGEADRQPGQAHGEQHHRGQLGQGGAQVGASVLDIDNGAGQGKLAQHIGQGHRVAPHRIEQPHPAQGGKQLIQQGDGGQVHPAEDDGVHQHPRPAHRKAPAGAEGGAGVDHLAPLPWQHGDGLHIGKGEGQLDDDAQGKRHGQVQGTSRHLQPGAGEQEPGRTQHTPNAHGHQAEKADGLVAVSHIPRLPAGSPQPCSRVPPRSSPPKGVPRRVVISGTDIKVVFIYRAPGRSEAAQVLHPDPVCNPCIRRLHGVIMGQPSLPSIYFRFLSRR